MSPSSTPRSREWTTGSQQRPPRQMRAAATSFDLIGEIDQLRRELIGHVEDRKSKTLVKESDLGIILSLMKKGSVMRQHTAPGGIAVHTILGQLRLHLLDKTIDLPAGHLLALDRDVAHDVEAVEESAFLITIT